MLDPHSRAQLCFIIQQYGQHIIAEPKRCRGMLSDLAPHHRLENNLLIAALEQKIVQELLQPTALIPINMQLARLAQRLHDTVGMKEEFADWAVESWAMALGVIQSTVETSLTSQSADSINVVRKKHPNAYAKWSANDDDCLRQKYADGFKIAELAKLLHRTESAIQSRVTKLNIQQKTSTAPQRIGKFIVQNGVATDTKTPSSTFFSWWIVGFIFIATVYVFSFDTQSENDVITQLEPPPNLLQAHNSNPPLTVYSKAKKYYQQKKYNKALPLFNQVAELGNAHAQSYLGDMYYYGYGVAKDNKKAVQWYRKAATQGNAEAKTALAKLKLTR